MRSDESALRATLVAIAASGAALFAHEAIDALGDTLLAHDAYDDVVHGSRTICGMAVAIGVLALVLRVVFRILDRRCASRTALTLSVRKALGSAPRFAVQAALAATVLLAAMEFFDCAAAHAPIESIAQLFGGSLLLGLGTIGVSGICAGWLLHRIACFIARYEPQIAALVMRLIPADADRAASLQTAHSVEAGIRTTYSLLLSRRGLKRGPPGMLPG